MTHMERPDTRTRILYTAENIGDEIQVSSHLQTHHLSRDVSIVLESEVSSYKSNAEKQRQKVTDNSMHTIIFNP